jgi:integrase
MHPKNQGATVAKQKLPNDKQEKVGLNAKNAAGLKLDGKREQFFWDDKLTGFALRLRREGEDSRLHRCWIAAYRVKGRYRRMTIADYEKLTAEQARAAAKKIFGRVAHGEDPMAERQRERLGAARTLRAVIDDYLAMKAGQLRPASLRGARLYLLGGYFRPLHASAITDITRADVAVRLNAIIKDSGPITARAARAALSAFFAWAWKQGIVEQNVVAGTEDPGPGESRERVLKDAELAAIWRASGDSGDYGSIIRLLMLTGCRRNEIGGLRWDEVDKDNATLTLPADRVKNAHTHTLPLLPMAQRIIDSVAERGGRDSLFGDRSAAGFTAWSAAKAELDKRLGTKVAQWRLHDVRRTAATWMAEKGHVQPHIIEAVLNHYSGHRSGTHGTYNRAPYAQQIRAALASWNDHLRSLIEGGRRKVLNFPQVGA